MPPLNYHHLRYFWTVARLGSIAQATRELHLTQPAISTQIRALERSLGEKLFTKAGRRLVLTEVGRVVYQYAEEIFTTGRELQETLAGRPTGRPIRLNVGITDAMPKLLSYRLLQPALEAEAPVRLMVREDKPERLLADLGAHTLDLVLSDSPLPPGASIRAHSHLLGECGVSIFGSPTLAKRYRRRFPASLDGAPFVAPTENTALRRSLDQYFANRRLRPTVVAEIEDSAVLKVFGQSGLGLFAAPIAVEEEVTRQYEVTVVGRLDGVRERFYAISVERRITNPAVLAITRFARSDLFA